MITPGTDYFDFLCELASRDDVSAYPPLSPDHVAEMSACLMSLPPEHQTAFVIQVQTLMLETLHSISLSQPSRPELVWTNPNK